MKRLCTVTLGIAFFASALSVGLAAQTSSTDTDKKIADLEKQLEVVRAGRGAVFVLEPNDTK